MHRSRVLRLLVCAALSCSTVLMGASPAGAGGSSWHWLNPLPRGETLNDVDIASADGNVAYAVGNTGCTIKTYDGGKSWVQKSSPTTDDLHEVCFVTDKIGWAAGDNGTILKMTDGATWTKQTVSSTTVGALHFRSTTLGWAYDGTGSILRTSDGGTTWNATSVAFVPSVIYFVSDTVGFAATYDGQVFKSTDGGVTWPTSQTLSGAPYITDMAFDPDDPQVGWITHYGAGGAFKTSDGGANWNPVTVDSGSWESVVCAAGSNVVWMGGYNTQPDHLAKIEDGPTPAVTVLADSPYGKDMPYYGIDCAGPNKMLAVGLLGVAVRTSDGGTTLLHRDQVIGRESLHDVQFIDLRVGFVAAGDGKVWKTANAGKTWSVTNTGNDEVLEGLCFVDANTGWAVGMNSTILKTTDGGASWTAQTSPFSTNFYAVKFVDANKGWIVGQGGTIMWTANGGSTWTKSLVATGNDLYDIDVLGDDAAAVGANGAICVTDNANTDGGSWMTLTTTGTGTGAWSAVDYVADNTFYIGGMSRTVPAVGTFTMLKTTNGGAAFSLVPADVTKLSTFNAHSTIHDMQFKDALNGWVCFTDGQVAKTANGGADWTYEYAMDDAVNAISVVNGASVWAVGYQGRVASNYWYYPTYVYRFYNLKTGTHFYTKDVNEKHYIIDNLSDTYKFEGVGFEYDEYKAEAPLYRFYKPSTNTHFFTSDVAERDRTISTLGHIYQYEGPVYNVSYLGGQVVYRFYKPSSGTHFYTGDTAERDRVISTLGHLYIFEGPAYYLPQ